MNEARKQFYTNFINENSSSQRNLFNATRKLLKQDNETLFPPFKDKLQLANEMGDFFVKKISDVHARLDEMTEALPSSNSPSSSGGSADVVTMETFAQLSESNVRSSVLISAKKTCLLDPIPTPIVVDCLDALLPVLTKIINTSLMTGRFADDWKSALVNPLLKKAEADRVLKDYRPVSNLQYVSKLTERAAFDQTNNHMILNNIYPVLQSSYRKGHSTETALLKVVNDIMHAYQTLLCPFEGLGREAVQAGQRGFVIGGTGTETIYQQTKWRTWLFSIWLSFDIVRFA